MKTSMSDDNELYTIWKQSPKTFGIIVAVLFFIAGFGFLNAILGYAPIVTFKGVAIQPEKKLCAEYIRTSVFAQPTSFPRGREGWKIYAFGIAFTRAGSGAFSVKTPYGVYYPENNNPGEWCKQIGMKYTSYPY